MAADSIQRKFIMYRNTCPAWLKLYCQKVAKALKITPKSYSDSLTVKECSWNAYPYTKTVFTTPALDKFNIDIETKFLPDPGISENVFDLSPDERENIQVDVLDMCR